LVDQPPDRVTVWQSQLAANDFPPVCVMTGAPAETWRRFKFSTAPPWAIWVGGVLVASILARRASGYLPMTRASVQRLRLARWSPVALLAVAFLCWILAVIVGAAGGNDSTTSSIAGFLFIVGSLLLLIGLIGLVVVQAAYGPTARVMEQQPGQYEPVVELRRVHPNFVNAVRQMQAARAAHHPSQPGSR